MDTKESRKGWKRNTSKHKRAQRGRKKERESEREDVRDGATCTERNSLNSTIENKRGMRKDKRLAPFALVFDLHRRLCECISMHIAQLAHARYRQ